MPRILDDEPCTLVLDDKISNSKLTLYFRTPTTDERIDYANSLVTRHGSEVEYHYIETRMKYGGIILTGFADGDFCKAKNKPLSWKQESPDYDARWKDIIKEKAADVLELLALHAFELSVVKAQDDTKGGKKQDPS